MPSAMAPATAAPPRRSRWPARLDLLQSLSGLALALFMWGHMLLVSSILLGKDAMWWVARFFEGTFIFGRPLPWLVSLLVLAVFALLLLHALLALRKLPISHQQLSTFRAHMHAMHHGDTTLWWWQVVTGVALMFMAGVHLYAIGTQPELIGPYESADRVWSQHFWLLYLVLLLAVELHAGIGLYRLAMKWAWFQGANTQVTRKRLKALKWALTAALLALGLATLAAYVKIGIEHAPRAGERYVPTHLQSPAR
jgi:fumarate reductase subunit C